MPILRIALAALAFSAMANGAHAQAFPTKPIRLIVPYAAGGAMDVAARIMSQEMGQTLSQPIVVVNREGGAGTIGADYVAKAAPDGYTLCWCPTGPLTITPLSDPTVPYHPLTDLMPVSHAVNLENVLMARKDLPANNFREFLALAKSSPKPLTYGTPGAGGTHHLGGEWLQNETGIKLLHVPYKGENPAVVAVTGGQIDLALGSALLAAPLVKEGRIKVLANLGNTRSKLLPDVPTVAESGFPNYGWYNFVGVNAPAGTPKNIVNILANAVTKAAKVPDVQGKLREMGMEAVGGTPEEYAAYLNKETATWGRLVKMTGITRQ